MRRTIPLILILMLLFIGCTRTPDTPSISSSTEPILETAEPPLDLQNAGVGSPTDPQSIEPTPELPVDEQPGAQNSSPAAPTVEPTPDKPKNEAPWTQRPASPASTVKPTSKPQPTPPSTAPSVTLVVVVPTLEPESTPKPTAKPTVKPTEKPTPLPIPPQPTEAMVVPPEESPAQPEKTESPTAVYTDATHLRSAFMDAINTEKAANGAASGSLDSGLCSIAQDRARQMAEACSASHIGSGYPETVGAMSS